MQVIPKISLQTILLPFLPSSNLSYHLSPPILRPLPLLYFHATLTLYTLHQKSVLFLIPLALPYSHLISPTSSIKSKLRKDNTDFCPFLTLLLSSPRLPHISSQASTGTSSGDSRPLPPQVRLRMPSTAKSVSSFFCGIARRKFIMTWKREEGHQL